MLLRSCFKFKADGADGDSDYDAGEFFMTPDDLLMLAESEDASSRLVTLDRATRTYKLEYGPFTPSDLQNLLCKDKLHKEPASLIINEVEVLYPPLSTWSSLSFQFPPNWRRDDCQVSLSSEGAGIGRHVDSYDVFLVQAEGRKEWRVEREMLGEDDELTRTEPRHDVRILSPPEGGGGGEDVAVLGPGDVLYLPPRFVHAGEALDGPCVTLSVGYRSPSGLELLAGAAEAAAEAGGGGGGRRYVDGKLGGSRGLVTRGVVKECAEMAKEALEGLLANEEAREEWLCRHVTAPKRPRAEGCEPQLPGPEAGVWSDAEGAIDAVFGAGRGALRQAEGVTFCYTEAGDLYADGEAWKGVGVEDARVVCDEAVLVRGR